MRPLVNAIASFGLGLLAAGGAGLAQDVEGGKDHPLLPRVRGAVLRAQDAKQLDAYLLPLGPATESAFERAERVRGKATYLVYDLAPDCSVLEAGEHFGSALARGGFETLFSCADKECGDGGPNDGMRHQLWFSGYEQRQVTAVLRRAGAFVYASVHVQGRSPVEAYAWITVVEAISGSPGPGALASSRPDSGGHAAVPAGSSAGWARHGPFRVCPDANAAACAVETGVRVRPGAEVELRARGWVNFGGGVSLAPAGPVLGLPGPLPPGVRAGDAVRDPDGENATDPGYPAPGLRKNSLLVLVAGPAAGIEPRGARTGRFYQGGTFTRFTVGEDGELVLMANDARPADNRGVCSGGICGWEVTLDVFDPGAAPGAGPVTAGPPPGPPGPAGSAPGLPPPPLVSPRSDPLAPAGSPGGARTQPAAGPGAGAAQGPGGASPGSGPQGSGVGAAAPRGSGTAPGSGVGASAPRGSGAAPGSGVGASAPQGSGAAPGSGVGASAPQAGLTPEQRKSLEDCVQNKLLGAGARRGALAALELDYRAACARELGVPLP